MIKTDYTVLAGQLANRYPLKSSLMILRDLCKSSAKELITNIDNTLFLQQLKERLAGLANDKKSRYLARLVDKKISMLQN